VSKGLVRSKTDNLMLVQGGAGGQAAPAQGQGGAGAYGYATQGATALKGDLASYAEAAPHGVPNAPAASEVEAPAPSAALSRAQARMKGYVGEACPECGNFTMVRNGTCLKCETCGSTTGCS
jgi:ribonucleoside-diphosphate reductase alpha chain